MFRFGEVVVDPRAREVRRAGRAEHLEPQAFDLLVHLIEHRDEVVAKHDLLDGVWGHRFVSEAALTTRVKEIRRALGDDGATQHTIRNVRGRGYRFVAELDDAVRGREPAPRRPSDRARSDRRPVRQLPGRDPRRAWGRRQVDARSGGARCDEVGRVRDGHRRARPARRRRRRAARHHPRARHGARSGATRSGGRCDRRPRRAPAARQLRARRRRGRRRGRPHHRDAGLPRPGAGDQPGAARCGGRAGRRDRPARSRRRARTVHRVAPRRSGPRATSPASGRSASGTCSTTSIDCRSPSRWLRRVSPR